MSLIRYKYPEEMPPILIADGFLARIRYRLRHDKASLTDKVVRQMYRLIKGRDEKRKAMKVLSSDPELIPIWAQLNKRWEGLILDMATDIPFGGQQQFRVAFYKDVDKDEKDAIWLQMRVFQANRTTGELYPTYRGVNVPADLALDIRNALDRLIKRHQSKLLALREIAAKKYPTNKSTYKRKQWQAEYSKDDSATKHTTEN